jgi:FAD binding domain
LGMNTGIQDAMNLGWKLAAEVQGWAPGWLLDSYHTERHPVGREALRVTDLLQRITVAPAPVRAVRPFLARLLLGLKPVRRALRRRISGLSIAYPPPRGERAHPWTGQRVPDVTFGKSRMYELMRGGRFVLLDRTGEVARAADEGWSDRVDVVQVPAATTPNWPAATLIRPDGYAAWASDAKAISARLSAGRAALRHWCGSASARGKRHQVGSVR